MKMKNRRKIFNVMFVVFILITFTQITYANQDEQIIVVNLSHRIERSFRPETATINLEVWTLNKDLKEAYTETTNRMNQVIKTLKSFENVTYKTQNFSINQRYIEEDKKRVLYYEVSTIIEAETDNLTQLGNIIERAVSNQATDIKGIKYGLKYSEKAKNQVIKVGIEEIKDKAEVIKESLKKDNYKIARLDINDSYNIYNYSFETTRSKLSNDTQSLPIPEISPKDVNIYVNFNVKIEYNNQIEKKD